MAALIQRLPPVIDFGDGGAFPEIHKPQFPLGMGMDINSSKPKSTILPVSFDAYGNIAYDAIVKQNENAKRIVFSQHKDLVPTILKNNEEEENSYSEEEMQKEREETTAETKAALEKILHVKLSAAQPKSQRKLSTGSKRIKYRTAEKSVAFNSGAKERIIRMVEKLVDPLEPPKSKHKPFPIASEDPPVSVLHSPPRPVSVADQKDWINIPPCISQFKNPKGYIIPLDKREGVDGRRLQDVQISEKFAHLQDSLHLASEKCTEELELRAKVQKDIMEKEKERRDQELIEIARKARAERTAIAAGIPMPNGENTAMDTDDTRKERLKRNEIRRERERERRLTKSKRSRIRRDDDRDISEKIALGMASTGAGTGRGEEVMYDQRLFNQQKGIDSGFGNDDQYNVYDKRLFTAQSTLSSLYRPKKDVDADTYGGHDEQLDKIMKTDRFKPHKGFGGTAERAGSRDRPVEFDWDVEEADPFGLDKIMAKMKNAR